MSITVGVISDTHGLLRVEALAALQGVDHILHAGDVGNFDFIGVLQRIAPVTAIRGNVDGHGPCAELAATEVVELGGTLIYMLHSIDDLDIHPHVAGFGVVVFGHSHKPSVTTKDGVLYLNPGSAGPRRFSLPVTLAKLYLDGDQRRAEILPLIETLERTDRPAW